jgi:hypothetical protein
LPLESRQFANHHDEDLLGKVGQVRFALPGRTPIERQTPVLAGIRVAGNLNIAALRVIGAENISVGGVSVGLPAATVNLVGALAGSTSAGSDAAKATQQAVEAAVSSAVPQKMSLPSLITVEVLGFGHQ